MGVCGIFRPPVQGGSNELISKFLSSMILYNHPSYFKSGEINSCRLSPLPTNGKPVQHKKLLLLWHEAELLLERSNHANNYSAAIVLTSLISRKAASNLVG